MKGLSSANLQYMRAFAAAWPDPNGHDPLKLPWVTSSSCSTSSTTRCYATGTPSRTPATDGRVPYSSTTSPPDHRRLDVAAPAAASVWGLGQHVEALGVEFDIGERPA